MNLDPSGTNDKALSFHRRGILKATSIAGMSIIAGPGGLSTTRATAQNSTGNEFKEPERDDVYRTGSRSEIETLNPLYNNDDDADIAIRRALDLGYTFDADGEFFPLLYDMSTENGEVWVFTIREDLQFSDPYGQVTAEDFVYQIQEIHQSSWTDTSSTDNWKNVNVEQTGDFEFQAELQKSQILWPDTYAPQEYPIPKELVKPYVQSEDAQGLEQDEELVNLQFTGNLGPYVLDEWNRGSKITYSRNDNYYARNFDYGPELFQAAPYFDNAEIVIDSSLGLIERLENGEIESARVSSTGRADTLDNRDNVDIYSIPQSYNTGGLLAVNMRDNGWNAGPGNLFRYVEFRQALATAISKRNLIENSESGYAKEHFTWQPPFSEWYPGKENLQTWGVDGLYGEGVAKDLARDAFDQSEHNYTFDGGDMVTPDGDQVSLELYALSGSVSRVETGEFIRDELAENLGLDVSVKTIEGVPFSTQYWSAEQYAEEGVSATINGEEYTWEGDQVPGPNNPGPREYTSNNAWDMSIIFGLDTYPLNPLMNEVFFDGPTGYYNPVGYYPDFDAQDLFQQLREATSREDVDTVTTEMFEELNREQPYIMLLFPDDTVGYNADLVGPVESYYNEWDINTWHYGGLSVRNYTNEDGTINTEGLRDAIGDWREGDIETDLLRDVIGAWRSGEPVE